MTDNLLLLATADAILAAIDSRATLDGPGGSRLTSRELDEVLTQSGHAVTGLGRKGRDDWLNKRKRLRGRINAIIKQKRNMTLEVVSRSADGPVYGLRTTVARALEAPYEATEKHEKGMRRAKRMLDDLVQDGRALLRNVPEDQARMVGPLLAQCAEDHMNAMRTQFTLLYVTCGLKDYLPEQARRVLEQAVTKRPLKLVRLPSSDEEAA